MSIRYLLFLPLLLAACSQQGIYEGMQDYQRNECRKNPALECPEKRTSYDEYQRERREVIEGRENQ